MGHPDAADKAQELPKRTEREPSSARSASEWKFSAEQIRTAHPIRGCCEPRPARAPARLRFSPETGALFRGVLC